MILWFLPSDRTDLDPTKHGFHVIILDPTFRDIPRRQGKGLWGVRVYRVLTVTGQQRQSENVLQDDGQTLPRPQENLHKQFGDFIYVKGEGFFLCVHVRDTKRDQ